MIMVLGAALGYIMISPQPDRFGRKPVQFISICVLSVSTLVAAYSYQYMMFLAMRFMQGFSMTVRELF